MLSRINIFDLFTCKYFELLHYFWSRKSDRVGEGAWFTKRISSRCYCVHTDIIYRCIFSCNFVFIQTMIVFISVIHFGSTVTSGQWPIDCSGSQQCNIDIAPFALCPACWCCNGLLLELSNWSWSRDVRKRDVLVLIELFLSSYSTRLSPRGTFYYFIHCMPTRRLCRGTRFNRNWTSKCVALVAHATGE